MSDEASNVGVRNLSGLLVKLEPTSEGGERLVSWDREGKTWEPVTDPSVADMADFMTGKPASYGGLAEAGIKEPNWPKVIGIGA